MIAPSLEQQVAILHDRLNEAFERILQLEQENRAARDGLTALPTDSIFARTSAERSYALQLCSELFPGSSTSTELDSDPDDPSQTWCVLVIQWQAKAEESLRQQETWHRRFAAAFPEAAHYYRLFVALE